MAASSTTAMADHVLHPRATAPPTAAGPRRPSAAVPPRPRSCAVVRRPHSVEQPRRPGRLGPRPGRPPQPRCPPCRLRPRASRPEPRPRARRLLGPWPRRPGSTTARARSQRLKRSRTQQRAAPARQGPPARPRPRTAGAVAAARWCMRGLADDGEHRAPIDALPRTSTSVRHGPDQRHRLPGAPHRRRRAPSGGGAALSSTVYDADDFIVEDSSASAFFAGRVDHDARRARLDAVSSDDRPTSLLHHRETSSRTSKTAPDWVTAAGYRSDTTDSAVWSSSRLSTTAATSSTRSLTDRPPRRTGGEQHRAEELARPEVDQRWAAASSSRALTMNVHQVMPLVVGPSVGRLRCGPGSFSALRGEHVGCRSWVLRQRLDDRHPFPRVLDRGRRHQIPPASSAPTPPC